MKPVFSTPVLGVVILIFTEIMVFSAFLSAFLIVKSGYVNWPPMGQPRLPLERTALNSFFLFASAWFVHVACRWHAAGREVNRVKKYFLIFLSLGLLFVVLQGTEWFKLVHFGLTLTSSVYGAFFYLIIGFHALHVVCAMAAMILLFLRLVGGRLEKESFKAARLFWFFVVGLWPVLYVLVYLA